MTEFQKRVIQMGVSLVLVGGLIQAFQPENATLSQRQGAGNIHAVGVAMIAGMGSFKLFEWLLPS